MKKPTASLLTKTDRFLKWLPLVPLLGLGTPCTWALRPLLQPKGPTAVPGTPAPPPLIAQALSAAFPHRSSSIGW